MDMYIYIYMYTYAKILWISGIRNNDEGRNTAIARKQNNTTIYIYIYKCRDNNRNTFRTIVLI